MKATDPTTALTAEEIAGLRKVLALLNEQKLSDLDRVLKQFAPRSISFALTPSQRQQLADIEVQRREERL